MLDNTFFLPYLWIVIFNPYFNLSIIARMPTENIYENVTFVGVFFAELLSRKRLYTDDSNEHR